MGRSGIVLVCCLLGLLLLGAGCAEQAAIANPAGDKYLTLDLGDGVTMKLALIPAGKFVMGSPKSEIGRGVDEGPRREVTISKPFYMGVYEVTQAQWKTMMEFVPWKDKTYVWPGDDHAANCVSWFRAREFCQAMSKKTGRKVMMPSEAQWEYACRAGAATAYSFGDDASKLGDYAWYHKNAWNAGRRYAHRVGQKKPNAFGLHDMHGNVHEWCRDTYDEKFYANAGSVDPENTVKASTHILRGGSWCSGPEHCRSACRDWCDKGLRFNYYSFGLRVVVAADAGGK